MFCWKTWFGVVYEVEEEEEEQEQEQQEQKQQQTRQSRNEMQKLAQDSNLCRQTTEEVTMEKVCGVCASCVAVQGNRITV